MNFHGGGERKRVSQLDIREQDVVMVWSTIKATNEKPTLITFGGSLGSCH
jgi:hypothetical protein